MEDEEDRKDRDPVPSEGAFRFRLTRERVVIIEINRGHKNSPAVMFCIPCDSWIEPGDDVANMSIHNATKINALPGGVFIDKRVDFHPMRDDVTLHGTNRLPPRLVAMLRRLIIISLAAVSCATVAEARAPNVEAAFGNTIVSTYPDGRTAHLWLKEDGSYTATGRRKKPSSGRWSIKGEKICLKQQKPSAAPFSFCTPAPSGAVGTSWKAKAVTGEPIDVKVVAGVIKG